MTVPSALRCSATNVENNLPLTWKMKGMNRKICRTVRQMRDMPLNIALKEVFVMIQLFSFRQKPWYFYELEDSKERNAWVWVEKKKWVPFRARSLRDDQTWNWRPFITFWISCDVEQATVLLSLETWSWFTRVWFTGIYPSKGQEASLSIIHLTRSKPSLTCKRIRQTEALQLTYTWLCEWIFQENIVAQSM